MATKTDDPDAYGFVAVGVSAVPSDIRMDGV